MARREVMVVAVTALVLLGVAATAATERAEGEDAMHRALFNHIQEIRALVEGAQGNDAAEVEQPEDDWIASSLGVVEEAEPTGGEADATSTLSAHSAALQQQDVAGGEVLAGALGGEAEDDGVVDPLVQRRFKVLEAALKGLQGEATDPSNELRVPGAPDVNLLERFAQDTNRKLHPDSGEHGHSDKHEHGHDQDHASAGSARESHACPHDHNGHSHAHQHVEKQRAMLPEEMAEEEDLLLYGFEGPIFLNAEPPRRFRGPAPGIWLRAMSCSLLVSLASLICLMLLPCIVSNGKPSEAVVNALASFGAGAMLGDAFLHQLPHAFGSSESSHSHDTQQQHYHDRSHSPGGGHAHAHSLQDLSVGLAVLGGILLFFIVEKIVRRYEDGGRRAFRHSHHGRQKKKSEVKNLAGAGEIEVVEALDNKGSKSLDTKSSGTKKGKSGKKKDIALVDKATSTAPIRQMEASQRSVMGYLNLFSDAVHNFTDGMALGSAFLLHGTVGGWSRTLFLLAHELPQEAGDFGVLVKSGFNVFEALAFNFLSGLVALVGTTVALVMGGSSGHSSLIEGFVAGGFIYTSVGGFMPSMHDQGSSLTSTLAQFVPMALGMGVTVVVSLAE